MLVITRKPGETVKVSDSIVVKILRIRGSQVQIGIEAPKDVRIVRDNAQEKK